MGQQFAGEWVLGDQGRILRYGFENKDKTAFDLTGATLIKLRARPLDGEPKPVIERSGTIFGAATNGEADFEDLTNGATIPQGDRRLYEAEIQFTKSSKLYFMPRFQYAVVRPI